MLDWPRILKESPIDWLLEETNPSVRYFTLRDILDRSKDDAELVAAKHAIRESQVVKRILGKQNPKGYWEDPTSPYHPKYKSTYWQVMTLGLLGMDKSDQRARKACEYVFQLQSSEGAFSSCTFEQGLEEYKFALKKGKRLPSPKDYVVSLIHEHQYSCLTGNMAAALIRIGYAEDPRVKRTLEWLAKIQNKDGGWLCPYWRAHVRDKHGCFFGTICPLEAFSEVQEQSLTGEMRKTIKKGAEFLLMHRLFKADHHNYEVISKHWLTLSFPTFCSYNIPRGLDVITKLGCVRGARLNDAVEVLLRKRQNNGTWILENTPTGRMQTNMETKGKPSKWITLIALRVLKRLGSAGIKS